MVLGIYIRGDFTGITRFVVLRSFAERASKRVKRVRIPTRGHRHDRRRIDTPRAVRAHGHVAAQLEFDRIVEQCNELLAEVVLGVMKIELVVVIPIAHFGRRVVATRAEGEIVARLEFLDLAKERAFAEAELKGEILFESLCIGFGAHQSSGENRFRFTGEKQCIGGHGPVERLDADPIARRKDALLTGIPDGEREHAVQSFETAFPQLFVEMEDDFGIALRAELMMTREFATQFDVVVDLTIEGDPDRPVFVAHGLTPGVEIDDRESLVAKCGWAIDVNAFAVRSSMCDAVEHRAKEFRVRGERAFASDDAGYTAHSRFTSIRSSGSPSGP